MNKTLQRFHEIGIIPVVVLDHKEDAAPLANALCEGGLPAAEVTFRTREAAACIEAMKAARPDMLVGAGTVLTTKQVDEAINAGALRCPSCARGGTKSPRLCPSLIRQAPSMRY